MDYDHIQLETTVDRCLVGHDNTVLQILLDYLIIPVWQFLGRYPQRLRQTADHCYRPTLLCKQTKAYLIHNEAARQTLAPPIETGMLHLKFNCASTSCQDETCKPSRGLDFTENLLTTLDESPAGLSKTSSVVEMLDDQVKSNEDFWKI